MTPIARAYVRSAIFGDPLPALTPESENDPIPREGTVAVLWRESVNATEPKKSMFEKRLREEDPTGEVVRQIKAML